MSALQQIQDTRQALVDAMLMRDWEAIGELDLACRMCVEQVLDEQPINQALIRENLKELLSVYRQLIEITSDERKAAADEMSHLNQAQKATKVYHLFR